MGMSRSAGRCAQDMTDRTVTKKGILLITRKLGPKRRAEYFSDKLETYTLPLEKESWWYLASEKSSKFLSLSKFGRFWKLYPQIGSTSELSPELPQQYSLRFRDFRVVKIVIGLEHAFAGPGWAWKPHKSKDQIFYIETMSKKFLNSEKKISIKKNRFFFGKKIPEKMPEISGFFGNFFTEKKNENFLIEKKKYFFRSWEFFWGEGIVSM